MAAGDVSDALETRVRSLAGDNTASFTQARIMSWMTEAQMDLIRRLPPDIIPELTEQVSGLLASDGTVAKPTDYVKHIEARYGACGYHAAFKPQARLRYEQQRTYMAATCTEPVWTFENEKLAFLPASATCYKLDYVRAPCAAAIAPARPDLRPASPRALWGASVLPKNHGSATAARREAAANLGYGSPRECAKVTATRAA